MVRSATAENQTHQATLIQEFIPSGQDASQFDGTCLVLSKMLGVMYQASGASPPEGIDIVIVVGNDTAAQIQQQS